MKSPDILLLGIALWAMMMSCTAQSTEKMMRNYLTFYYPATTSSFYEIAFDWGRYTIISADGMDAEVHADSKPYRGYMTMRPTPLRNSTEGDLPSYLISSDGTVWLHQEKEGAIPAYNTREEVTIEGSTTTTVTINSGLEPLVDHFKAHPELWKKYGVIVKGSNGENHLELVK